MLYEQYFRLPKKVILICCGRDKAVKRSGNRSKTLKSFADLSMIHRVLAVCLAASGGLAVWHCGPILDRSIVADFDECQKQCELRKSCSAVSWGPRDDISLGSGSCHLHRLHTVGIQPPTYQEGQDDVHSEEARVGSTPERACHKLREDNYLGRPLTFLQNWNARKNGARSLEGMVALKTLQERPEEFVRCGQRGVSHNVASPQVKQALASMKHGLFASEPGLSVASLAMRCGIISGQPIAEGLTSFDNFMETRFAAVLRLTELKSLIESGWGASYFGVLGQCSEILMERPDYLQRKQDAVHPIWARALVAFKETGYLTQWWIDRLPVRGNCTVESAAWSFATALQLGLPGFSQIRGSGLGRIDPDLVWSFLNRGEHSLTCALQSRLPWTNLAFALAWSALRQLSMAFMIDQVGGFQVHPRQFFPSEAFSSNFTLRHHSDAIDFPRATVTLVEGRSRPVNVSVINIAASVVALPDLRGRFELDFLLFVHYLEPDYYSNEVTAFGIKPLYRANSVVASNFGISSVISGISKHRFGPTATRFHALACMLGHLTTNETGLQTRARYFRMKTAHMSMSRLFVYVASSHAHSPWEIASKLILWRTPATNLRPGTVRCEWQCRLYHLIRRCATGDA